ncbi:tRNA-dihydrouridine(16/17) synthase [NAD(P)(+)]-like protein, variant 6 [Trebouxia sp. C0010 RCD-2024]
MASPILSAEACSLYDLRNVSGGYLRRQVLNVPPKTTYLSSIRRLVCTAVHGNFAEGVPSTSMTLSATDLHAQQAWEFWRKIGSPKYHVAPMVDQSELAFRQLCLRYGATAAYTPMLHSRLFLEDPKYRAEHFTTCPGDRPLFVQFCANNPSTLLQAAELVQDHCDAVDINLGCPQRIARKGKYGAFLMEQMELIESLVTALAQGLRVPVTCKIRVFPELERTLAYAHMLERAGCSVLAVHGRTREQKQAKAVRADWNIIKAVREAVSIPVLANGNIRHLQDVHDCIAYTGVQGVMSAESLLEDPALFWHQRLQPGGVWTHQLLRTCWHVHDIVLFLFPERSQCACRPCGCRAVSSACMCSMTSADSSFQP